MQSLKEKFLNPQSIYRGAPFWSLNDLLDDKELERQIKQMAKEGMGGFFMHSRVGLLTPYLSEEWMKRIKNCVNKARESGIKAWLYDEDRWPSGFAGGVVPAKSDEYKMKRLRCDVVDFSKHDAKYEKQNVVAIFRYPRDEDPAKAGKINFHQVERSGYFTYIVFVLTFFEDVAWFNGGSYLDTLNPKAVDAFIESTYQQYYERFGNEFGKTIPGIFTDEPSYCLGSDSRERAIPWTKGFENYFQKKKGYSLADNLISLFFNVGDYQKIRFDYWNTVSELFAETYTKRIDDWCRERKLLFTGHFLGEDDLTGVVKYIGNAMLNYQYMQLPGVDHLGRNIDLLVTMKQAGSVANQLGRERVLSELYGTSGWNLSFEDQKWIGDWEYSLGVNLRCQHLALYTLRGCRKRDFPPSIFYQQPWWKYHDIVADYFGRLSVVLSSGQYKSQLLLIHPINSAYVQFVPGNNKKLAKYDKTFQTLSRWLCELHWSWEYGDESIMSRYAKADDRAIKVGRALYKVVVIPPTITLASSTLKLLSKFVRNGGRIFVIKPTPTMIDGEDSTKLKKFIEQKTTIIKNAKDALQRLLNTGCQKNITVRNKDDKEISDIYVHHRILNSKEILFLNNINREKSYEAIIEINTVGKIENWDPRTGDIDEIDSKIEKGRSRIRLHFVPTGSYLLVIDQNKKPSSTPRSKQKKLKQKKVIKLATDWKHTRLDPNILTLDYCSYKIGDEPWSDIMPVWKAQVEIRDRFGLRRLLCNDGISFWKAKELGLDRSHKKVHLSLRHEFHSEISDTDIALLVETLGIYNIALNGQALRKRKHDECPWMIDPCLRKIDISPNVHKGKNEIVLACHYDGRYEFESIYLVGNFGIVFKNGNYVVSKEPDRLRNGDWTLQGYPFFVGTIRYEQIVELDRVGGKFIIEFDELKAIVTRIVINGKEAGIIPWKPYSIEITKFLKKGQNSITIELTTSLHNMLGPHHHKDGEIANWASPESFCDEKNWKDDYTLVENGIFGDVRIIQYE